PAAEGVELWDAAGRRLTGLGVRLDEAEEKGRVRSERRPPSIPEDVFWNPDSSCVAVRNEGMLAVWDAEGRFLAEHSGATPAWEGRGDLVALASGVQGSIPIADRSGAVVGRLSESGSTLR